ncbi:MAG: GTPase Der [candidate division WS2 bacterium ADurb.Bin280]|uniref:GTPase Der n=1 Tax=candidate division WS2 bacterium ADurb.Bin280 TaxID=1852829 RepID=A0A1V5SEW2_9BACT|nr:MAG: GTPase Der [candidate division WS2 bacterium ADurb.Bin280]
MQESFTVAIIGRPNVGKSTLFNRIVGFRQAITSKEPGTTRDRVISDVHWNGKNFTIIDTAGLLLDFYGFEDEQIERMSQTHIEESLQDANLILCVISVKDDLTESDKEVIKKIRKSGKEVILVCNKADSEREEALCDNFLKTGIKEIYPISAKNGRRIGVLLDRITAQIQFVTKQSSTLPKISIIGRPNVGKSTLFNALVQSERSIVSDIPGTTRDSIDEIISLPNKKKAEIIDTAGFRKRGRRQVGVEKFSIFRSIDSIGKSDLVLVVVNAQEGITRGDAHLVQFALDKKKEVIVVINKIDCLVQKTAQEIKDIYRFKFINKITNVAISAKSEDNLNLLLSEIVKKI